MLGARPLWGQTRVRNLMKWVRPSGHIASPSRSMSCGCRLAHITPLNSHSQRQHCATTKSATQKLGILWPSLDRVPAATLPHLAPSQQRFVLFAGADHRAVVFQSRPPPSALFAYPSSDQRGTNPPIIDIPTAAVIRTARCRYHHRMI